MQTIFSVFLKKVNTYRHSFAFLFLFMLGDPVRAQFTYTLTGNPVNTTGWTIGTPTSYISGNTVVLNNPVTNQAGYIYYSQPVNLTGCAEFTVNFEYQITNNSAEAADGIAFWYITTPPSAFIIGGGIGLPNNSTGLALFLDTYSNDGNTNNPLVTVRSLNNSNYVEGSTTGLVGADVLSQGYIIDGNWHSCQVVYNNGNITVSMDGGAPIITGSYSLNMTGYFGFSASTGAYWSKHAIRNVVITGATVALPVVNSPVIYCQGDAAVPLTATGTGLKWYTTSSGGTQLPGAPTPNTSTPGTYKWYVSQTVPGCGESGRDSIAVIINPKPIPPVVADVTYCRGQAAAPLTATGQNLLWYDGATGGVGTALPPVPQTAVTGRTIYFVSQRDLGCESERASLAVDVVKVNASAEPVETSICYEESVRLSVSGGSIYKWYDNDGYADPSTSLNCTDCEKPVATPKAPGDLTYHVIVTNAEGCKDTLELLVHVRPLPVIVATPADITIGYGMSTQLSASGGISYWWDPASSLDNSFASNPIASPGETTTYVVVGKNEFGCLSTDTSVVRIDYKNEVFIPSAFTPNSDGRNDVFKVSHLNFLRILEFRVFNRWGNEVFSTTDPDKAWDGSYGGKPAETGTYFYSILLANPDGATQAYKGDVTLIR